MEVRSPEEQDRYLYERRGKIELTGALIRRKPALLKAIIGEGVVVHTEYNAMMDITTFWVHHPDFRLTDLGCVIPTYKVEITQPKNAGSYDEIEVNYVEDIT